MICTRRDTCALNGSVVCLNCNGSEIRYKAKETAMNEAKIKEARELLKKIQKDAEGIQEYAHYHGEAMTKTRKCFAIRIQLRANQLLALLREPEKPWDTCSDCLQDKKCDFDEHSVMRCKHFIPKPVCGTCGGSRKRIVGVKGGPNIKEPCPKCKPTKITMHTGQDSYPRPTFTVEPKEEVAKDGKDLQ